MEEIKLDLVQIVDEMDEEEKSIFENKNTNAYFNYVYNSASFKSILGKIDSNEEISDSEWIYLLKRLFVVSCRAMQEEDRIDLSYKLLDIVSKIGIKVCKKGTKAYDEFNVMTNYINSIRLNREINRDLINSLKETWASKKNNDLKTLLKQHNAAYNFRDCKDKFYSEYSENGLSGISSSARMSFNSLERFYQYEKELVKTYE